MAAYLLNKCPPATLGLGNLSWELERWFNTLLKNLHQGNLDE